MFSVNDVLHYVAIISLDYYISSPIFYLYLQKSSNLQIGAHAVFERLDDSRESSQKLC